MTKKLKKRLQIIAIAAVAYIVALLADKLLKGTGISFLVLLFYLLAYGIAGGNVIKKAVQNISHGEILDENFLMLIATIGAFLIGEYPEAVAVMLFYQIGEWFQAYALNRSRKSIKDLMDIRPDYANLVVTNQDGQEVVQEKVNPEEIQVGDVILIKPGEKVPLDGVVIEGFSTLDTMALTGESLPREVECKEEVISGCVNLSGLLKVKVQKPFAESTVSKILELVENASSKKAKTENFITRFARYYTPFVVVAAVLLALIPPLIFRQPFSIWLYRALSFLVISCPCALVISIPLSFFGGLGAAGKVGILVKGSSYLEILSKAETVVMDKTGTLTKGIFTVKKIVVQKENLKDSELLKIAAMAERYSNHPISVSIMQAYEQWQADHAVEGENEKWELAEVEEIPGRGVKTVFQGKEIYVGNNKLMKQILGEVQEPEEIGTIVHIADNLEYYGYIAIADEEKKDAASCVKRLKKAGVKRIVMLTGDRNTVAEDIAKKVGIQEFYGELLPADKVKRLEQILTEKSENGKLIYVGDGMNDAPVLARADIGIAMGGLGQDAAIEAADIVIMTDEPSKIAVAMKISKKTLGIVKQNIALALSVKFTVLLLAAVGMATMWAAVFSDVGVAVLAILNAMRAMNIKEG